MPEFFVPLVEPDNQEAAYQDMAKFAGAAPRAAGNRIYSMTWRHDGVVWTATVGETLTGVETVTIGRGRDRKYREVPRSTNDTVMAIFPGAPGLIVHDDKSKRWANPILTGEAIETVRFD